MRLKRISIEKKVCFRAYFFFFKHLLFSLSLKPLFSTKLLNLNLNAHSYIMISYKQYKNIFDYKFGLYLSFYLYLHRYYFIM